MTGIPTCGSQVPPLTVKFPTNQAVSLGPTQENDDAIVSLNFKVRGITENIAARGKCLRS